MKIGRKHKKKMKIGRKHKKKMTILKWKIKVKLGRTTNLISISPEVERLMQEATEVNEGTRPDSTSTF